MPIRVVTDSGADVPPRVAEQLGLRVVPLTVRFGDQEFCDGVDLSTTQFYARLREGGPLPNTAQPSPAAFAAVYAEAARAGERVLSIHLSGALSGTVQSARLAAAQVPECNATVLDTRSASLGVGMIAIQAARAAAAGLPDEAVIRQAEEACNRLAVFFLVATLDHLVKNGRIGRAQGFVGNLLQVQPLLTLTDGVVEGLERVRGRARARQRLVELVAQAAAEKAGGRPLAHLAVMHAAVPQEAEELATRLAERVPAAERWIEWLGPTIGAHTGPGCLGVLMLS